MRLEIEQTTDSGPVAENAFRNFGYDEPTPSNETLLKKGISAAQSGDRALARTLLLGVTENDPANADAWLWLASISEYPEELLGFLNNVLEIDPGNERARQWEAATQALLAKTFVQRGVLAKEDGQTDLALQYFETALEHDSKCEMAWFWKASLAESENEKVECLERVLLINGNNEDAQNALKAVNAGKLGVKLGDARSLAVTGDLDHAEIVLNEICSAFPDSLEAWSLRSMVVRSLEDKLAAYDHLLELDPENVLAQAGHSFLRNTFAAVEQPVQNDPVETEVVSEQQPLQFESAARTQDVCDDVPDIFEDRSADRQSVESTDPADEAIALVETSDQPEFAAEDLNEQPDDALTEPQQSPSRFAAFEFENSVPADIDSMQTVETAVDQLSFDPAPEMLVAETAYSEAVAESAYTEPESEVHQFEASNEVVDKPVSIDHGLSAPEPVQNVGVKCPYCRGENEPQAFGCNSCKAVLAITDIEALLSNDNLDRGPVEDAVAQMEAEWNVREFNEGDLTVLGIGHFNLKNYERGLAYLQEASSLNPNNVILAGQVNSLAIRLEEMRRQNEVHDAMPKGKTILVVDDSATVRKLISSKLEKSGHNVLCAVDGIEAMEVIENTVPDLVLLDIAMPRMDGYSVCKLIRANNAVKDVPVVMISGKDGFFDKVRGRMAGTTGYITKPFGPETLMRALETYLLPDAAEVIETAEVA